METSQMETRIDCDLCGGRGSVCENTGLELASRDRCTFWCRDGVMHGLGCSAVECSACGGLGYLGCRDCGEPLDRETWGNYGRDPRAARCIGCERWATMEATEPGRVVASEWGDEPTRPEIQIPFSALDWDAPMLYQAPPAGVHDNDSETRELPAVEVL